MIIIGNSSSFTTSLTGRNDSRSGTRTPRKCARELRGRSLTTVALISDVTLWHRTSRQVQISNSHCHFWMPSRTRSATDLRFSARISPCNGKHQRCKSRLLLPVTDNNNRTSMRSQAYPHQLPGLRVLPPRRRGSQRRKSKLHRRISATQRSAR